MPDSLVEKKLASFQAWIIAGLTFMFVAACMFVGIAIFVFVTQGQKLANQQHESNQALACYVQPQFDRAETTLPTLQYYKEHPDELENQLELIRQNRQLALEAWGVCEVD